MKSGHSAVKTFIALLAVTGLEFQPLTIALAGTRLNAEIQAAPAMLGESQGVGVNILAIDQTAIPNNLELPTSAALNHASNGEIALSASFPAENAAAIPASANNKQLRAAIAEVGIKSQQVGLQTETLKKTSGHEADIGWQVQSIINSLGAPSSVPIMGGPAAAGKARAEPAHGVTADERYIRRNISKARYGDGDKQTLLADAYRLKGRIDKAVIGQESASTVLRDRLVQYLENLGSRKKEPIALHLIGLPGIGKSSMLDHLEATGIPMLRINAQRYTDQDSSLASDLRTKAEDLAKDPSKPKILVVEEIDKLAEFTGAKTDGDNGKTNSLIGTLNEILSEGKLSPSRYGREPLDFSNFLVITTMNFAPAEISNFSKEVLNQDKSFYDFTPEDFQKLDDWMRKKSSSKYKILSTMFRSNTVSRMAPNTILLSPLNQDNYRQILKNVVDSTIARNTAGANAAKRLQVTYTEKYLDFLAETTVFGPSGARETVSMADLMTEQLISYSAKAAHPKDRSLSQPRRILIDFDPAAPAAVIEVTPQIQHGKTFRNGAPFTFRVAFNKTTHELVQPVNLSIEPPKLPPAPKVASEKPITKREVREYRFPKAQRAAKGLADAINKSLIGQEEFTQAVEREMNSYLGRPGPAAKEPPSMVFAGFPGIGKSELVTQTGKYLDIPIVRINMQSFSSDSPEVVTNFVDTLQDGIEKAKALKNFKGKYIVLFEEIDKAFEVDPTDQGKFKNRPVMGMIKDMLNDGHAALTTKSESGRIITQELDLRDAFIFGTMNFAVDLFGFKADPRWTSIADVRTSWRRLRTRLADMKDIMSRIFLPETVSRLMSRLHIMAPLTEAGYKRVIDLQADFVIKERLYSKDGKNTGLIDVKLTPAYKKYLFQETVVPSEGPRHTSVSSRLKISADLEKALKNLNRSSRYAAAPIIITLDFHPGKSQIVAKVLLKDHPKDTALELFRQPTPLFFPPLEAHGRMEERRIKTSVHEFGHAYTGVRLGLRFDYATVVPPFAGVGGYVKFSDPSQNAKALMASIYSSLGSRAMERIFLSKDPLNDRSVLDITSGPSNDIQGATMQLYNMLYEYGFNPKGGTMDRLGIINGVKYADFAAMPPDLVQSLGLVLRDMEDYLVQDLLKANSREWYVEKITQFARAGGLSEEQFYKILGYPYPGDTKENLGQSSTLQDDFKGTIKAPSKNVRDAKNFKQGKGRTTTIQNVDAFSKRFNDIIQKRLSER